MESSTPRIHKEYKPWRKQLRVVVRQRAPDQHSGIMCASNFVSLDGQPYYFDRVFGPREKNLKLLEFYGPALYEFINGRNACIIGFGEPNSGVSWTLGTNPCSNGLVPGIYWYLRDHAIPFLVKAQWIQSDTSQDKTQTRSPSRPQSFSEDQWHDVAKRQDLKFLLDAAQPPPGTRLIFWFSLVDHPDTKLALVDLSYMPKSLANFLCNRDRQEDGASVLQPLPHDLLLEPLAPMMAPDPVVMVIACICDTQPPEKTLQTINMAAMVMGNSRPPSWTTSPLSNGPLTPSEDGSEESPFLVKNELTETPDLVSIHDSDDCQDPDCAKIASGMHATITSEFLPPTTPNDLPETSKSLEYFISIQHLREPIVYI